MKTSFKKQIKINKNLKNLNLNDLVKYAKEHFPMIKSITTSHVYEYGLVITVNQHKFLMDGDCDTDPKHNYEISTINPKDATDTVSFCTGSTPVDALNNLVDKLKSHVEV